jgi:indolepyruvate ferredoxin oxidoreductase beta subunit
MKETISFLLAGVCGQGTILASDVLAHIGAAAGYQLKQAEVHGMSQRGGSVTSYVRWGKVVYSPLVGEKVEALRNLSQLRSGALALINMQAIQPITVTSGDQSYPDDNRLRTAVAQVTDRAAYVDGTATAESLGNVRAANVVLLGALSALMEREKLTGPELTPETWSEVIGQRVPAKYVELNRRAFQAGREAVT